MVNFLSNINQRSGAQQRGCGIEGAEPAAAQPKCLHQLWDVKRQNEGLAEAAEENHHHAKAQYARIGPE